MALRRLARAFLIASAGSTLAAVSGTAAAAQSNLQETSPLIWVMLGISVAGALITYGFLAYAIWRYRDPHTRGRRYG